MRLCTGHNRLTAHMFKTMKLAPSPICSCGLEDQTAEHVLQICPLLLTARTNVWPTAVQLLTPNSTAARRNWRRQPHSSCGLDSQCSGNQEEEELYIYIYIFLTLSQHEHMHEHTCTQTHMHTHTHTRTHTHTHTHTHTRARAHTQTITCKSLSFAVKKFLSLRFCKISCSWGCMWSRMNATTLRWMSLARGDNPSTFTTICAVKQNPNLGQYM